MTAQPAPLPVPGAAVRPDLRDQVARQKLTYLGWLTLERIGHASGDRRIDRAVKPVLREKRRHAEVLEGCALAQATRALFPDLEA